MSTNNVENITDKKSCRVCLSTKRVLCPLFRYKLSGNYAEMLTAIADVKVSSNDGLPDKICVKCCTSLEKAFLLKTVAERSDRLLRKKLCEIRNNTPTKKIAFNSFTDIKSEIGPLTIKTEPKWDVEIEVLTNENGIIPNPVDGGNLKDIVIADTVIRKVEPNATFENKNDCFEQPNLSWKRGEIKTFKTDEEMDPEYLEEDFFNIDDDDDDYVPPADKVKNKSKFKKPKLSEIKVFKEKKVDSVKRIKVLRRDWRREEKPTTLITCYPITKTGNKGAPILLKRPKDATVLKVNPSYKPRERHSSLSDKPVRIVKSSDTVVAKHREKLVCPVCGILTYTLGNHMATHQEKKRYICTDCPKSFAQKSNLLVHMKQHSGVKDHICEICGAGFYCQKGLIRHNLIHKGDRPFGCNLCPKRFIARCDLNRHLRIHSGYKPFKCNTCTMSFNAKHQLQNHERMHTGERPYTCQVCNVAFSYKVNLNNHVFKVHGINLKFKSIHTFTEDILRGEQEILGETRVAISHIMPPLTLGSLGDVPAAAAHETVPHHATDHYSV